VSKETYYSVNAFFGYHAHETLYAAGGGYMHMRRRIHALSLAIMHMRRCPATCAHTNWITQGAGWIPEEVVEGRSHMHVSSSS